MGWSWGFSCSCALLLISVCAAYEDGGQREVSFDIDEMPDAFQPAEVDIMQKEVDFMQKEVDFGDGFEPIEFPDDMLQRELTPLPLSPDLLKALRERGASRAAAPAGGQVDVTMDLDAEFTPRARRPAFGPRSSGGPPSGPPSSKYPVQFPLGQPTPANLQAVCLHGDRRPRYSDAYFPGSGYGQLKRRADAVNRAEAWFSLCCTGNATQDQAVTLCCVIQAWETSVHAFCDDDLSVKDRHYHCCKISRSERLKCFQKDAPNPEYHATEEGPPPSPLRPEPGFTFNPHVCKRSRFAPRAVRGKKEKKAHQAPVSQTVDVSFPPGRPTAGEIESICAFRKLRPRYDLKCLPRKGYGWLARQSKAVNRVERGFKRCCKGKADVLACADGKWREEMDKFCREEKDGKMNFPCCAVTEGEERYACFHGRAPSPGYGVDRLTAPETAAQNASLGQLCDTHKIIKKKKFQVGFPVQSLVKQCCPSSAEQGTACVQEKLVTMSKNLCSARKPSSPSVRQCCHTSSQESSQCISNLLVDAITKATNVPRLRKRKCPLS